MARYLIASRTWFLLSFLQSDEALVKELSDVKYCWVAFVVHRDTSCFKKIVL